MNCYLRMVQLLVMSTNHTFVTPTNQLTWAGFTFRVAPSSSKIRNIFPPNIGKDQKKSYHQSAGHLSLCHMVNPSLVITLRS